MRNALIAAAAAAVLGGAANAADFNTFGMKDEPAYAPIAGWTGFYLGAGIGGAAVYHDLGGGALDLNRAFADPLVGTERAVAGPNGAGENGILGTIQLGYDYNAGRRLVLGAFTEFDFADIPSNLSLAYIRSGSSYRLTLNSMWSIGGRAGYLVRPDMLVYALGAYTQADFGFPRGFTNGSFAGYSVGGGVENQLYGGWFLKGEYRFSQFKNQTIFDLNALLPGSVFPTKLTDAPDIQSGRLSLVYKFTGPDEPFK